ncbi:MAG: ATP-binding protein [Anaerolineae bacterium]|nr:ATP-binding protein [Anaerolineae bacterium]MDW7992794.1 ATP-binding protein [Anaerolineae bacterium]
MAEELDRWFPRPPSASPPRRLGIVVGGSLSKGLEVKLDPQTVIEGLAVGRYVVVHGRTGRRFFSLINDVALDATNPLIEKTPPDASDPFIAQVHRGTTTFGRIHVAPMLVLEPEDKEPRPVKTVPEHFSEVYEATPEDVALVFGQKERPGYFVIGEPLDMAGIPVTLNLERFVERSAGVFGKTGTGKTFLTRTLLAGIIHQNVAVTLVFDMHNEYGWKSQDEARREIKGLRQLFPTKVAVFTLDEESSRRRGSKIDGAVYIGYDQIEPEDVDSLSSLLALTDVQVGALYFLRRKLGPRWLARLLNEEDQLEELQDALEKGTLHGGTLGAIQRKLNLFRRFGFLLDRAPEDPVQRILEYLGRGVSVVLEFGRYGNSLEAYILVANYITRRIHEHYVRRKEAAQGGKGEEPRPLVITVEEAHKFLDPAVARHTIFGTIARELRKYNVTLLIVDQRPSGIDPEVMSQIGTRVTCLLDDEADIRAVFSGVAGAAPLREVLARLDTRQQALILGHAVPMPVVVRTRSYGEELYAEVGAGEKPPEEVLARGREVLGREEVEL